MPQTTYISSLRQVIQPLTGFTLLTLISVIYPSAGMAQLPNIEESQPTDASGGNVAQARQEAPYTLGGGDQVAVTVFNLPQYSGEFQVLANGTLNLPVAGDVSVEGMTLEEASNAIAAKYQSAQIIRNPTVSVKLLQARPLNIEIAGEVARPGSYTLNLQETGGLPTVTQALEVAGGIRLSADLRDARVRRSPRSGSGEVVSIDLKQLLQTGATGNNIKLRDGDTIVIPAAESINPAVTSQIADASFYADEAESVNVAVAGEVFRPGSHAVSGETRTGQAGRTGGTGGSRDRVPPTVTRAIQVAGGIRPTANVREVLVRRPTRNGSFQTIRVDLFKLLRQGDTSQDVVLQEGDKIFVPNAREVTPTELTTLANANFAPNTIQVSVVGEVNNPGAVEVKPNTPLNKALLAAGGVDQQRAHEETVTLVRLNRNGTISQRQYPLNYARGINEQTNPPLRNNDVIIVGRDTLAGISDTLGTALEPLSRFFSIFNFVDIFRD
ncbi:MAG: hypothetical protein BRC50_15005 [Cyanobacteria bacterium SW_11_48_12]|nr:MAG: hypothetical protein BRC50_15005 [Cyanobacteria bacterium SW_11_48_12]